MEYRVEELASRAGLRVDTVRFYQAQGLLPPPRREGRIALYSDAHVDRLRRIRQLSDQGLTLALVKRVLEGSDPGPERGLLEALAQERAGEPCFTRAELAEAAGIPEALIAAAVAAGLVEPLRVEGEERFGEADLRMARAGLEILKAGLPLDALLALAVEHSGEVRRVTDRAIDLFDRHVRKGDGSRDPEAVTSAFRTLLPQVTRLVALHFQRTLVSRALARLEDRGESEALRAALAATEDGRLEVGWK